MIKPENSNRILHMHPGGYKLIPCLKDLINYYKWEYVTILYHEGNNFNGLQDLIKLDGQISFNKKFNFRIRVRQLSSDITKWKALFENVRTSGSSHIVVDIQTKYMHEFIQQVSSI